MMERKSRAFAYDMTIERLFLYDANRCISFLSAHIQNSGKSFKVSGYLSHRDGEVGEINVVVELDTWYLMHYIFSEFFLILEDFLASMILVLVFIWSLFFI